MPTNLKNITVECDQCGCRSTAENINLGHDNYHHNGDIIRLGKNTTQEKINRLTLICECCEEDNNEKNDY